MSIEMGGFFFGLVIGWITYRTLRRRDDAVGLSDISTVIGAVGGAAVTKLFPSGAFPAYALGLAIGFFAYLLVALAIYGKHSVGGWMRGGQTNDGP